MTKKKMETILTWAVIIFVAIALFYPTPYDDTDNVLKKERSGLQLFTDQGTGCQYLRGGGFSSITPRLNGKGEHVGCRP